MSNKSIIYNNCCFILFLSINASLLFIFAESFLQIVTQNYVYDNGIICLNNIRYRPKINNYIWLDSTKYNLLCSRIKGLYNETSPILTFQYDVSGFGSQLYTILTSALIATAVIDAFPYYNMVFNGCFSDSIINSEQVFSYQNLCKPWYNCFPKRNTTWDINEVLHQKNSLLNGIFMQSEPILFNQKYHKIWQNLLNGVEEKPSMWNMRKNMLRLILNPEPILQKSLLLEKSKILKLRYTIGLQLRMGGNISDSPESYVGIPFYRINEVIDQVREVINKKNWTNNVQVYISSDSSKTIQYVRNMTRNEFPVVESLLFEHGHSKMYLAKNKYVNIMKKILADMYYMSISDYLLVSWQSSLGRMMCFLAEEEKCDYVLKWNIQDKAVRIK